MTTKPGDEAAFPEIKQEFSVLWPIRKKSNNNIKRLNVYSDPNFIMWYSYRKMLIENWGTETQNI